MTYLYTTLYASRPSFDNRCVWEGADDREEQGSSGFHLQWRRRVACGVARAILDFGSTALKASWHTTLILFAFPGLVLFSRWCTATQQHLLAHKPWSCQKGG
jgi:hypothetical protein